MWKKCDQTQDSPSIFASLCRKLRENHNNQGGLNVKHAALSRSGRLRIEWADRNIPVMKLVRERFRKEKPSWSRATVRDIEQTVIQEEYLFQYRLMIDRLTDCWFVVLAAIMIGTATNIARAELPILAAGVRIQEGSSAISVDMGDSSPEVVDWNNDGKIDLLIGQYAYGAIRLYINQGTSNAPSFNGYTFIQCADTIISVDYG
jgi:hypothetical protein